MRISTTQFYETSAANYSRTYANVTKTGDEVASQVKLNTAGDDPVGAGRVLQLQQMGTMLNQYKSNIDTINTGVVQTETALTAVTSAIQRAQELVLAAGNATFTDKDRQANAAELKEVQTQILGLMNSQDADGTYLFSGSKGTTAPYALSTDGTYSYQGDQTRNQLAVGSGITMASNTTGWDAFEQAINTTRTSMTLTSPAVNDNVIALSGGSVTNSAEYNTKFTPGEPYSISFQSSTQFKILDKDGTDVTAEASSAGKFTSTSAANQTVGFRGLQIDLNVNLTDAQYGNSAQADTAVAGHTFTLAVSNSTVSTSRLPGNPSTTVVTDSKVTDQTKFNETFPSGGAIIRFSSATDFALYAAPYDAATSKPVSSGTLTGTPVANQAVASGVTFTFSGSPVALASGDQFTAQPASQQNQNILNTLSSVITALNGKVDGDPVAKQKLQATLTSTIGNLTSAANQINDAVSDGGARAKTATDQSVTNQNLLDNGSNESSSITASDPVDAIARLTLQKTMLQASQLVFTQLSALNLFSKL
ncbi:flagellar hook-associated protein 3 [Pseudomonas graminis]|jgi:flagellar hook-associated protein 3 FlgL|uniref:Flagellar hook-associated protein 3 n=1 Tax=Pseudomonas graminis TaxID=158627 RepID=A0A6M8MGB3_9PSED|nr:flagellar hook-associated protein 3 [Pseudomonas graminis]QKF53829.1 Flagellar hook-associated protein 3 [Pseudomonas graminis]